MKRFISPGILPCASLLAGVLAAVLRIWLLHTGVDSKGLYLPGHPSVYLLLAVAVLLIAAVLLTVLSIKKGSCSKRFPRSIPAAIGNFAAAAGVLYLAAEMLTGSSEKFLLLLLILSVPTAVCFGISGYCRLKGTQPSFLVHSLITVYFMAFLLIRYTAWSVSPRLLNHCFEAFACICLMLAAYYRAALSLRQQVWRMYAFTNQLALFLCCLTLVAGNPVFYLSMFLWTLTDYPVFSSRQADTRMPLPDSVRFCLQALEKAGYQAYVVGGCVRDHLLGNTPHDYDLCTSATPEQMRTVFSDHQLVRSGEKHGTIGVVLDDGVCEITTFRAEGGYTDNRHPDWIAFVSTLEQDLLRRDFTVNAIAYSPSAGYVDPYNGRQDLRLGILRAVGDPEIRFREDALRILRGIRFSVRFRFTVDPQTEAAMQTLSPLLDTLARERVYGELCKLLPLATAEDLLRWAPTLTQVIPELEPCRNFDQHSPHHRYDVYTHTAHVVAAVSEDLPLRWAALLHDIGKPAVFQLDAEGRGHFHGHATISANMADEILHRLKAPTALREQVLLLIRLHMTPLEPDRTLLLRRLSKYGKETVLQLLALQKADYASKGMGEEDDTFDIVEAQLTQLLQEDTCLSAADLAINGRDILALGIEPGPRVGACMRALLTQVQDGTTENTKEALLEAAQAFLLAE